MPTAIEPITFVSLVRPLLECNDLRGLIDALRDRWNCGEIARLAVHGDRDARKVALLCLAIVGERECIEVVAAQLADPDKTLNQMAEHALWSIWCRCGSSSANAELCAGAKALAGRKTHQAIEHFDRAISHDRDFAEAYNQRAIARFLQDQFEESIADCRKVVRLMPCHFGAWAGMGHCFVHLGQMDHAVRAYERALSINPHMDCVRESLTAIQQRRQA